MFLNVSIKMEKLSALKSKNLWQRCTGVPNKVASECVSHYLTAAIVNKEIVIRFGCQWLNVLTAVRWWVSFIDTFIFSFLEWKFSWVCASQPCCCLWQPDNCQELTTHVFVDCVFSHHIQFFDFKMWFVEGWCMKIPNCGGKKSNKDCSFYHSYAYCGSSQCSR